MLASPVVGLFPLLSSSGFDSSVESESELFESLSASGLFVESLLSESSPESGLL